VTIRSYNLRGWTKESIDRECKSAYRGYESAVIDRYTRYFAARPHLRCPRQRYSARTVAAALPPGLNGLQQLIPPGHLHRYARSGRSSQILALSILGAGAIRDPTLGWFWRAIGLSHLRGTDSSNCFKFEHALAPTDLDEYPRVTKLDLSVSNSAAFAAIETKWSEPGLGICSCLSDGDGNPAAGHYCASRVATRSAYWRVAQENFGLERERIPLLPCSVSVAYQAVRSVAAARHLAGRKVAAFVLLFDATNPYFSPTGKWPGWPAILETTLMDHGSLLYRAISWQKLVPRLPLSQDVLEWAVSKHRLVG
jgi:hypothetical protein